MSFYFFFFFNDTATPEIYTLSLHDALPISSRGRDVTLRMASTIGGPIVRFGTKRSEEHTSELQSQSNLVCRLMLEKKKKKKRRELRLIFINILTHKVNYRDMRLVSGSIEWV